LYVHAYTHSYSFNSFVHLFFLEPLSDSGCQFTDTRVIRKKSVDTSQATFNRDHWQKCPRDTPDPNEWETDEWETKMSCTG